jgi:hypothetical protein
MLGILIVVLLLLGIFFKLSVRIAPPIREVADALPERTEHGPDIYSLEESWFKKNEFGLWELYLEGDALERGLKKGVLAREQIQYQEEAFIARLKEMIPSERYLGFLKQVVLWMNRDLDKHIPVEYQEEIYGVSRHAAESFEFIGPPYERILNYHAAHDIGHALQNMNLVACTALGLKGSRTSDGKLLVGRNFDFHMGEDFARNKIIAFYRPTRGYNFASITWGGMIGVVSGMNDQGLVVSLNAAKSGIPGSAKTPVSILARHILQYASTVEEAWEIAAEHETFVAESFLVSSRKDGRTVVIEKRPDAMDLYDPGGDQLILTNHFQSDAFKDSEKTVQNKAEGASVYRWERSLELLQQKEVHDVASMVDILRDQEGLKGQAVGMGNEMALNQLVAHHSVVFQPDDLKMWVSAGPFQLGSFLCYDLSRVFHDSTSVSDRIYEAELTIGEDPFLSSPSYTDFRLYQEETARIRVFLDQKSGEEMTDERIASYLSLNPSYYYPHFLAGEIYRLKGELLKARTHYEHALSLEIPRTVDRSQVEEALEDISQ